MIPRLFLRSFAALLCAAGYGLAGAATLRDALDGSPLGLYGSTDFRIVEGACDQCATIPQALWYFRDDTIAVPTANPAGFSAGLTAQEDVRDWIRRHPDGDGSKPPLLWIGSPQVADDVGWPGAAAAGAMAPFGYALVRRIETNLSYFDESSARHFAGRKLKLRGRRQGDLFVARTTWPIDYALDFARLPLRPLDAGESLVTLVRADDGGARGTFDARVLWQRAPGAERQWAGRPVLAFMLNGAQGDDDEAHGGHFGIVTGVIGRNGEWGDWLVNNFYDLDSVSEKGIISATLPMDAYLADLNSGQSWYRPSYMLVAVLRSDRAAALYQQAVGRVYNHFYRHDFVYRHSIANCAGISMQTLRSIGWRIPLQGPTSRLKAALALPYLALADRSLRSGRQAFDYLVTEQTDLYPFAAFDAAGRDLLGRIVAGPGEGSRYESVLHDDLEAVVFLRIPQFPSSRAFGRAPILSIDEYRARVPADKSKWKIVPVAARPFPEAMKDRAAPADRVLPSVYAQYSYGALLALLGFFAWRHVRRRRAAPPPG